MPFDMAVVYRSRSGFDTAHLRGVADSQRAFAEECAARVRANEAPAGDLPISSVTGVKVSVPWAAVVEIQIKEV